MMKTKKGVSPLIATVLIIALTVALTVFLMNWAFNFFKERTSETSETTKEQLLCASGIDFDVRCDCTVNQNNAGACNVVVVNNNNMVFTGGLIARLIAANQKATTVTSEENDDLGSLAGFAQITAAINTPSQGTAPYDAEVIVKSITSATGKEVQCGSLAKQRKVCSLKVVKQTTTTT